MAQRRASSGLPVIRRGNPYPNKAGRPLTNASGFFFERDGRLFLVTSRHVVADPPLGEFAPDSREMNRSTRRRKAGTVRLLS